MYFKMLFIIVLIKLNFHYFSLQYHMILQKYLLYADLVFKKHLLLLYKFFAA